MIEATDFINSALNYGFNFWTGVPCSFIKPLINTVISDSNVKYTAASSEGEAIGIAAGAHLAGCKTVVMFQNSGLGNAVNPLTSLNYPFRIPTLLIVTHRGEPGLKDEPQHELMGQVTKELLDVLRIPWRQFPTSTDEIDDVIRQADGYMKSEQLPFALIMSKGSVNGRSIEPMSQTNELIKSELIGTFKQYPQKNLTRFQATKEIIENLSGNEAIIATTGKIGRELYTLGHRNNQLYMVGSMGCASGMGLGFHIGSDGKKVVVIDGDGAVLMKMGTLATIGNYAPENLTHIVLDNEAHESTGGQATVSSTADLALVACACEYRNVWRVDTLEDLAVAVGKSRELVGPNFIHVKVALESDPNLGRPNLSPVEIKNRFIGWVKNQK